MAISISEVEIYLQDIFIASSLRSCDLPQNLPKPHDLFNCVVVHRTDAHQAAAFFQTQRRSNQ